MIWWVIGLSAVAGLVIGLGATAWAAWRLCQTPVDPQLGGDPGAIGSRSWPVVGPD